MSKIEQIRKGGDGILAIGNHAQTLQSVLDFDFIVGKKNPSIVAIIGDTRKAQKFFFGEKEILIPCFSDIDRMPEALRQRVSWMLNTSSGRRVYESTLRFFAAFPKALGGHIFAEKVPEKHATALTAQFGKKYLIAGPSGVGLCVAGHLKLGVVSGTDIAQLESAKLATPGSVAVVSTSGGMTNELIRAVVRGGHRVSFAFSIGGDRFPITSLTEVLKLAQEDPATKTIVYFGELGGTDEYEIAEALEKRALTKPIVCYIGGIIDEAFDEHMQFGHAKALVAHKDESARAKRAALVRAGAIAHETFPQFLKAIADLSLPEHEDPPASPHVSGRRASILSTCEVVDLEHVPTAVVRGKLAPAKPYAFAHRALAALLGHEVSDKTAAFVEHVFELRFDHGGHVSGAVNTMITARAGKDMVSSLAAGLLTIGPRFGGAVNEAARAWEEGVASGITPDALVLREAAAKRLLAGIGHKKYRVGLPDPRVAALASFADLLKKHLHYDFARGVERMTTAKSGNLILNVDGCIAALLLDLLVEEEGYDRNEIHELLDTEFFNALFIIPRSVGFIAHFLEQKRNDEGLFRLPDDLLLVRPRAKKRKH
ncbi:hypothetical protein HYT05_04530 [Candidatus Kaiserbacteria bacterium]|nr:hypothetical protein [Candidatus Kaiserbacteria bacterium]